MTLTEERFKMKDGAFISTILVAWTAVATDQILRMSHHLIQTSTDSGATYRDAGTADPRATSFRIELGTVRTATTYTVRVKTVSDAGTQSPGLTGVIAVTGKGTPPSNVDDFVVVFSLDKIVFKWSAINDADLFGYEIRVGNLNSIWETASIVVTELLTNFYYLFDFTRGIKKYFIKSIDNSGNYSEVAAFQTVNVTRLHGKNILYEFAGQIWQVVNTHRSQNNGAGNSQTILALNTDYQLSTDMDSFPTNDFNPTYNRLVFSPKTESTWLERQQAGGTWANLQDSNFIFGLEQFVTTPQTFTTGPFSILIEGGSFAGAVFILDVQTFSSSNLGVFLIEIASSAVSAEYGFGPFEKFENGYYDIASGKLRGSFLKFRFTLQSTNADTKIRFINAALTFVLPDKDVYLLKQTISADGKTYFPVSTYGFTDVKAVMVSNALSPATPSPNPANIPYAGDTIGEGITLPDSFIVKVVNVSGDQITGLVNIHIAGY